MNCAAVSGAVLYESTGEDQIADERKEGEEHKNEGSHVLSAVDDKPSALAIAQEREQILKEARKVILRAKEEYGYPGCSITVMKKGLAGSSSRLT